MRHARPSGSDNRRRRITGGFFLALALALLPGAASAQLLDGIKYNGLLGFEYSNGDYGTDRNTDVELGLGSLGATLGNVKLNVSIPYLRISGRGLVIFDAAGNPEVINRTTNIAPDVRTGWGDVNLAGTYTVPPDVLNGFQLDLTARVKLPTASTRRRLGTGGTDFGGNFELSHQFGIWDPFVSIGYLIPGRPVVFTLDNTVSASAGTSVEISDKLVAIGSYDFDSPSSPLLPSSQEAFGSLSWLVNDAITLTGYGTAGLSSGAPKVGAGLLISYGFD